MPEIFLIDSLNNELVIFDDYFILYKNSKPYYYKKIDVELNIDDLKLFIKNNLGIQNIKITYSKNANLKRQDTKIDYKFIKAQRNQYFLYFILYLFTLCCIFIYFYMNIERKHEIDTLNNLQINIEKVKDNKSFTYISKEILQIYENAKDNSLIVNSILFENSKFLLILQSEEKEGIYKLLTNINNSLLEDMQYNKNEKRYEAHVSFKISRK